MNCPKCGAILPDGSSNCSVCGVSVRQNFTPVSVRRCPQCLSALPADAKFCGKCGLKFAGEVITPKPAPSRSKKPLFIAIALIALAAVIGLTLFLIFRGNSPEEIAELVIKASYGDVDADDVLGLLHEDVLELIIEKGDMDEDELKENLEDRLEEQRETFEDQDIEVIDIEIRSVKDMKRKEIKALNKIYEKTLDLTVTEGKTVKVKITYEEDGDENSDTLEIPVVKIDGKYYLDLLSFITARMEPQSSQIPDQLMPTP